MDRHGNLRNIVHWMLWFRETGMEGNLEHKFCELEDFDESSIVTFVTCNS
jgi:hypothetical protein